MKCLLIVAHNDIYSQQPIFKHHFHNGMEVEADVQTSSADPRLYFSLMVTLKGVSAAFLRHLCVSFISQSLTHVHRMTQPVCWQDSASGKLRENSAQKVLGSDLGLQQRFH